MVAINQSCEKLQALQARLRNQLREIEEPIWDKLMSSMLQIDIIAQWGNWISLNEDINELTSIHNEAALIGL